MLALRCVAISISSTLLNWHIRTYFREEYWHFVGDRRPMFLYLMILERLLSEKLLLPLTKLIGTFGLVELLLEIVRIKSI